MPIIIPDAQRKKPPAQPTQLQRAEAQARANTPSGYEYLTTTESISPYPFAHWQAKPISERPKEYVSTYVPKGTFDKVWNDDIPIISQVFPIFSRPTTPSEKEALRKQAIAGTIKYESGLTRTARPILAGFTIATAVSSPVMAAGAIGGVGVGTGVKYSLTGQPLTNEEIIMAAGAGEFAAGSVALSAKVGGKLVKSGYNKLANTLSPERAIYNRVVGPANVEQAKNIALADRLIGKLSPERALYNRNVLGKITQPKTDLFSGGGFQSGKSGSSFASQVLYQKPIAITKATPMKPFLPMLDVSKVSAVSLTSTAIRAPKTKQLKAKTVQVSVSKQQTEFIQVPQRASNPFLKFSGKPFYQTRSQEEAEELIPIVYPKSGLKTPIAPKLSSRNIPKITGAVGLKTGIDFAQIPGVSNALVPEQVTGQVQQQRAMQSVAQVNSQLLRQVQRGDFPRFGGDDFGGFSSSLRGRWRKTRHNVKPYGAMLRTFGFSVGAKRRKTVKVKRRKR